MDVLEALKSARELMDQHGLNDWRIQTMEGRRHFGKCCYDIKTIRLSEVLITLNSFEVVKDVIIHEIAHAKLTFEDGHSKKWRDYAKSIGGTGERLCRGIVTPKAKYYGVCPICGDRVGQWFRKPFRQYYHRKCGSESILIIKEGE